MYLLSMTLREKCPNTEFFFWFVFSCIWTEYGDLLRIQSEYRKIRTRNNSLLDTFHIVSMENKTLKDIRNIKSMKNYLVIRTGDTLETTEKYCHIEQIIFPCFLTRKKYIE